MKDKILGIDIGGSGVKGALVDIRAGEFASERVRVPTPSRHAPDAILRAIGEIVETLDYRGAIGCGFPGVVRGQIIETAANLGGKNFIGFNLAEAIGEKFGCGAWVVNDADAAGIAEMRFGAGKNAAGTVVVLTIGTGIGVSMFVGGVLVPNLEFGHLKMRDKSTGKNADAEKLYSDAVRKANDLSWKSWAGGLNKYLKYLHALARPELIIIGGGVSAKSEKFFKYLDVPCEVVPAKLENRAGIIGAAFGAYSSIK